jgi:predicted regulator of Ras-like GTPase activity (Roadblock/LC7/MglB family)
MTKNDRTVSQREDGRWANKRDGADRAASLHATQAEAAEAARQSLRASGGGELKIKGEDGKIRSKDTVGKLDPYFEKG